MSVATCLWFNDKGSEAAHLYVSLLPNSRVTGDQGMKVTFVLDGAPFEILNGGPNYKLTPAASICVSTTSQAETDRLWMALLKDGGEESRCGWLVDKFGVSWQIVPDGIGNYLGGEDEAGRGRAIAAMMGMNKLVLADLEAAYKGTAAAAAAPPA